MPRPPRPSIARYLLAIAAASAACGQPRATLEISIRSPRDPGLLEGVDTFVFSVANQQGDPLVLRRVPTASGALELDDVPFGPRLTFSLRGLFGETPIVDGRSCPTDVLKDGNLPTVSIFVARVGSFAATAPPPMPPGELALAIPSASGVVLIAGGSSAGEPTAATTIFDARTGLWSAGIPLDVPRGGAALALLSNGDAVAVGGQGPGGAPLAGALLYQQRQGFRVLSDDPALALVGAAAVALPDSSALISGGTTPAGAATSAVWLYDRATLQSASPMRIARSAHTLSAVGSVGFAVAFAIGGVGADGRPLDTVEIYTPGSVTTEGAFTLLDARLSEARAGHTATVLPTGRILIVAGRGAGGALRTAELLDPISGTVRPSGVLADARSDHAATLLEDGRVLVTGGTGADGAPLSSAEIYDPAVGSFAAARRMSSPRSRQVAVALCDGTILIAGGGAGAEIYNPPR